jgi:hypothetical protein
MAKTWDNFFPYVQPHVPGCPEIIIQTHLQEAAAEYIARSELWRFDIDSDFTSKNTSDYEIDVPTDAVLENILTLFVNGTPVNRVTDRHFHISNTADTSAPTSFSIYQDSQIRFFPTPDRKYTFEGVGVLKPSLSATGVEDFIFETHGRSIACGAIWRLTIIPGKEWSNPELAMYYKTEFYKHMDAAKGRDTRRVNLRMASVGFDRATARGGR